jgi:hypothetical protein
MTLTQILRLAARISILSLILGAPCKHLSAVPICKEDILLISVGCYTTHRFKKAFLARRAADSAIKTDPYAVRPTDYHANEAFKELYISHGIEGIGEHRLDKRMFTRRGGIPRGMENLMNPPQSLPKGMESLMNPVSPKI